MSSKHILMTETLPVARPRILRPVFRLLKRAFAFVATGLRHRRD